MNLDELDDATLSAREGELLAAAIDARDVELLDRLLVRGVYPDAPPSLTVELVGCPGWRLIEDLRLVPLVRAAAAGGELVVQRLIAAGADPRVVDVRGRHAMFRVTSAGAARAMADAGLPVDHPARPATRRGPDRTAMRDAIFDGDVIRAAALLGAGADPNATWDRGYTLLMEAASSMSRDVEMLRLLIQHGADPHTVTQLGWNVLHAAVDVNAEANRPESVTSILTYLHSLGVDTRQRDHRGMTPLARAGMLGTELEVEVLRALGSSKRR